MNVEDARQVLLGGKEEMVENALVILKSKYEQLFPKVSQKLKKSLYNFVFIPLMSSSGKFVVCKAAGQGKNFERGIGVTEDCLFPFKHNAKLYTGCVPSIDGKGPWCATKVNNKGIMQRWARCNGVCNTDKGTYSFISYYLFV